MHLTKAPRRTYDKPFLRPYSILPCKSKRPLERTPVTIAVGFLYDEGLLLCADTQFTGQIKLIGSKILSRAYDDGSKSAFVVVGHARYARMCVNLIEDSIADLGAGARTLRKMHRRVITYLKYIHQEHLFKHPTGGEIKVQFLIGLWSAKDKALAFIGTEETAVTRMYGYDCLGSGETLAHHYIRHKYRRVTSITQKPKHTEKEVRRLAMEALHEVKNYDPYCGGDSECLTLTNTGQMSFVRKLTAKVGKKG